MCTSPLRHFPALLSETGRGRKSRQRVKSQLDKSGCRILGVVLNKVSMERSGYYSKYYGRYGKYGKYSKYGKYGKYGKYEKYEKANA